MSGGEREEGAEGRGAGGTVEAGGRDDQYFALREYVEDAMRNAEINGIENVEFFVGKAEEVLPREFEEKQIYADVIVVDPPRKGCDQVCLDTIVKMGPKRVVYVSCDSATLGRDVKYLGERGFEVERVRGCDMFGMGGHVESVIMMRNCGLKGK